MRLFDLSREQTILVAPRTCGSLRSLQLETEGPVDEDPVDEDPREWMKGPCEDLTIRDFFLA